MIMKCALTIIIMVVLVVTATSNNHYNANEFKKFCKILRVAEGEPEKIPEELNKFIDTTRMLESLLRATRTSTATYQKVVRLSSTEEEDADFISYTVKRKTANAKIQHAMEKVKEIYSRMEEELIQADKERTQARNNLVHAIYGVQVGQLPRNEDIPMVLQDVSRASISNVHGGEKKVKFHDTSEKPTCGGKGESGAGFTLINDFYCLCVGKENTQSVCHENIGGPCCCCCKDKCQDCKCDRPCDCSKCKCDENCKDCPHHNKWLSLVDTSTSKILDLPYGWPHIRKVCEEVFTDKVNTTSESIQEVLGEFNKLLGSNSHTDITAKRAESDSRRLFVLGYAKEMESNGCSGKSGGDTGVCVNYWAVSNLGVGIVWQNYMLEAQKHLQAMDKHVKKAKQLSKMIQKLKESAEESYRKSAHGSMLWPIEENSRKKAFHNFFIFFLACFDF